MYPQGLVISGPSQSLSGHTQGLKREYVRLLRDFKKPLRVLSRPFRAYLKEDELIKVYGDKIFPHFTVYKNRQNRDFCQFLQIEKIQKNVRRIFVFAPN